MKKSQKDILLAPISQLTRWIKTQQVTVTEVVSTFIAQSEKINADTNSYQLTLFDEALEKAREMDQHRGPRRRRLWGIPFTLKSQFDVENIPTTVGTTGRLYAPNFPTENATVVQRLLDEGAILLGLTTMPEAGAAYRSDNRLAEAVREIDDTNCSNLTDDQLALIRRFRGGEVKNPYDLTKTPGGSSGGESSIIAGLGSPFGLGTDALGSIRLPAVWCGLTGIKPSRGRIPTTRGGLDTVGEVKLLGTYGPLAKYVEDLELIYEIISGDDGCDTLSAGIPPYHPPRRRQR
ncbi:MAG TPA: hypothetical protein DCP28_36090, partial [Cytophagales bacterium]|nr:hypothetical protein [Cytophagales bacterium]